MLNNNPAVVPVVFTWDQFQALMGLIDNGVRATGLRGAKDAAKLVDILENAVQSAMQLGKEPPSKDNIEVKDNVVAINPINPINPINS